MNESTGKEEKESKDEISRRKFIQGTTTGVALMAGGALLGAAPGVENARSKSGAGLPAVVPARAQVAIGDAPSSVPTSWSQTADVVVVGYGGAGAVTAITAFDAGAKVLVLEKTPSLASLGVSSTNPPTPCYTISGGGGNTQMSGGGCVWPMDPIGGANYMYFISWGETPFDVYEAWANVGNGNKAWFDKMGIPYTVNPAYANYPNIIGASSIGRLTTTGSGPVFFKTLDKAVQSRGIPVLFNTAGTKLIQNPTTKEILGVQALSNYSQVLNIRANRAVVLCTGGFEANEAMLAGFLKCYPVHTYGWGYNTGDGINMALDVGAGLWHTSDFVAANGFWVPQYAGAYSTSVASNAYIFVDKYGKRWINETIKGQTYAHNWAYDLADINFAEPAYSRIPYFIIFDSVGLKAGPLGPSTPGTGNVCIPPQLGGAPVWSRDNSAELAKGWIIQGATSLADLANAINSATIPSSTWETAHAITIHIDPSVLTATVNQWNTDCAAGKGDTVFGRAASAMLPISTPPFYALPQFPAEWNTQGGPIRNAKAQVCGPRGDPIPRLYSAGELGSIIGLMYQGSADLSELVAFGQIAGNNAANETPWTS
jgi:succinate dehydrogenase/fumarate reductase flavoprotein subunit